MDARELVQIAIALTKNPEVSVRDITLTVETDDGINDIPVHSTGDLLRPLHIGEVCFTDAEELIGFLLQ